MNILQKKKIAFFLKSDELGYTDFSHVEDGNPGVGGSEYMVVLVAHLLNCRENNIDVILYTLSDGIFPKNLCVKKIESLRKAIIDAEEEHCDYFAFKYKPFYIKDGSLDFFYLNVKLMPWCHNFASSHDLSFFAKNPNIFRIICVSKEQMESYIDHEAYKKSVYLYNAVNTACVKKYDVQNNPIENRKNVVTYIGSIIPEKGLHWIAEIWSDVLAKVPDAELHIIGSGRLYQRDAQLGRFGIAEKNYEDYLMKYFTHDGKVLPSVHFHGVMGEEKNEILLQTKVGIPNPSGKTETFGITAVEMQLMGCFITTIECVGYLDTVFNGFLYKRKQDFLKTVLKALETSPRDYRDVLKTIYERFSHTAVISQWENFVQDGTVPLNLDVKNINFKYKWAKCILYKLKNKFPILYRVLPSVLFLEEKYNGVKRRVDYLVNKRRRYL